MRSPSLLLFLLVLLVGGCASSQRSADAISTEDFLGQLRGEGVFARFEDTVQRRLLDQSGRAYRVSGDIIEVYEYKSETSAVLDVERISPGPFDSPSVYQRENLIVLHFGSNSSVRGALENLLGSQVL